MTPQEAIKWADGKALEIICELEVTQSEARKKRLNEEYAALTTLKSCAESRVPQKPIRKDWINCPSCNWGIALMKGTHNCPKCGQALDWSDAEC